MSILLSKLIYKNKFFRRIFIAIILSLQTPASFAYNCGEIYSALVFESKTGKVLYQKRSNNLIYPASLTKLMTLYLTFEALEAGKIQLNQKLLTSKRAQSISAVNRINTLKLKAGDQIAVKDAINGSIVRSFNETTTMLAEAISGSEWKFVKAMNKKAHKLGMSNTHFKNTSGLHSSQQYTTSYDMARLVLALINDFYPYYSKFSQENFKFNSNEYPNTNNLLLEYDYIEGMKTGYTRIAGFNLITAAKKENHRIISILTSCASLNQRDRFTKELLDVAFFKINNEEKLISRNFLKEKKRKISLTKN